MSEPSSTPRPDDEQPTTSQVPGPTGPAKTETTTVTTSSEPARSGLGLNASQVVGGSLAAATAALLGSKLGTTGTIVGAALVSLVTAVGGALYTASLRRTREVVIRTKEILPTGQWRTVGHPHVQDDGAPAGSDADVAEVRADGSGAEDGAAHGSLWSRVSWKPVAVLAAAVFVVAGVLVTAAQLATNTPTTVTRVVTGDGGSDRSPSPSPTPSQGATTEPSGSTSASPSDSASDEPTAQASTSPSPSATTSASPSSSTTPSRTPTANPTTGQPSSPVAGAAVSQTPTP